MPAPKEESFFLWGPRLTGKTTLLKESYPHSLWIDLLKAEEFRRYTANPEYLRQEIEMQTRCESVRHVVIDEIQKVPALLDEVHWLIENQGVKFALSGSSARKVKRGASNLLGGRALRHELHGITAHELDRSVRFDAHAQPRLPAVDLPIFTACTQARRIRIRLPQGGNRFGGIG